jgi:hypothetical protein
MCNGHANCPIRITLLDYYITGRLDYIAMHGMVNLAWLGSMFKERDAANIHSAPHGNRRIAVLSNNVSMNIPRIHPEGIAN